MAFPASKPTLVKQLKELLQEQQEPFELDVYLSERRYRKKSFSSENRNGCHKVNSSKNLKRPCIHDLNKKRTGIPNALNCNSRAHRALVSGTIGKTKQIATNWLSSASILIWSGSSSKITFEEDSPSSEQDHGSSASTSRASELDNLKELEAATDKNLQPGIMEDKKQLSTVSMLKELTPNEVRHFHVTTQEETPSTSSFILPKNVTEDSIFSASLWELLMYSLIEKQNHVGVKEVLETIGSGSSQYLKAKRVLQQTKQLLFDCVMEAIENSGRKGRRMKHTQEFLGPEKLEKIINEHICSWGKQSGGIANITQLIHSDFSSTIEEWSNFQLLTREIGIKIGNAIMDEIVVDEIVVDTIDLLL